MKSRVLCEKCQLTIYAESQERLDEIARGLKCYCAKPQNEWPEMPAKECVGGRKVRTSLEGIMLVNDLYE